MRTQRSSSLIMPLLGIGVVAAFSAATLEFIPARSAVRWVAFPAALSRADSMALPVFVDVYADWCSPCKTMDHMTFSNDTVRALLSERYIATRMNIDAPAFTDSMKEAWRIRAVPTSIVLAPDGRLLRRRVGYVGPGDMIDWLGDSTLQSFGAWRPFFEAKETAQKLRKPLLVVATRTRENAEEIGQFFADSTMRMYVASAFIPTFLAADEGDVFALLESYAPVPVLPPGGMVISVFSPDMRLLGQLPVSAVELGDQVRFRALLQRFVGRTSVPL